MPQSTSRVLEIFQSHLSAVQESVVLAPQIVAAAATMIRSIRDGGKVLACGNGGSAADAQHFACELVGRFQSERPGIAALALTTDPSTVTSISNDFGFEHVFSRQIEALGQKGDVLLAVSTSGNSANVVRAVHAAKQRGMNTVAMTGLSGGELALISDICLMAASKETPRIQEVHELIIHSLCELIEVEFA